LTKSLKTAKSFPRTNLFPESEAVNAVTSGEAGRGGLGEGWLTAIFRNMRIKSLIVIILSLYAISLEAQDMKATKSNLTVRE